MAAARMTSLRTTLPGFAPAQLKAIVLMRRTYLASALINAALVLAIFATPSAAVTFTVFGPQEFKRDRGSPATAAVHFSVLNPGSFYIVRVSNGDTTGNPRNRVSSAAIAVNGVNVVGREAFNQRTSFIERDVELIQDNELTVELRGKPGGTITIEIVGIDNDPPTITAIVSPPPNAAGWNRTDVTVSFQCSDAASGIASCPDPVMVTDEGAGQVVEGTAVDRVGLSSTARVTVNLDKTPPGLAVSFEEELGDPALEVKYVTQFDFIWNDRGSGADSDGAFYRPIAPPGYFVIGHYAQGNYNAPDGVVAVVKELEQGALAKPVGYQAIWTDYKSGAYLDGAIWRPIPPAGYTCIGVVATGYPGGGGYAPPDPDEIRCVRSDLAAPGTIWLPIWNDSGSGGANDLGTWIVAPSNEDGVHLGLMAARGYRRGDGYAPPTSGLWVLDRTKVRSASPNFQFNGQALELRYVKQFDPVWNDSGSGANYDGAFYKPVVPPGYDVIGYYGQGDYGATRGAVAVVKELVPGALAQPTGYQAVWTDSGSGSNRDGAFWRPIPPDGYVCLGDVVTGYDFGKGYAPPSPDAIRCVRREYTAPAKIDRGIWNDTGSGADGDVSVWHLVPGVHGGVYLGTLTSVGGSYSPPSQPVYTLRESVVTGESWVMASVASASGVASDALSGVDTVMCNGVPATLADSTFECDVSVTGHTQVTVVATDVADNESVVERNVTSGRDALDVEYATSFQWAWDDSGSGAVYDGAFYRPVPPVSGFSAIGHYGQGDYGTPYGLLATARERTTGALAPPVGYELIWADVGSGATDDGAFWWPLPQPGYRCLGVIATNYWSSPPLAEVLCPKKELVAPGYIGSEIWNDDASEADRDFGSWQISPSSSDGLFTGTFAGQSYPGDHGYAKPSYPVYVFDDRGVASSPPMSEEEISDLIATHAPVVHLHHWEQYRPDDPERVLDAAKLQWALVRNEGSYDDQYFEHPGEMPTSAATLMNDVAYIENEIRPFAPYNDDPGFRIWLGIPQAVIHGDLASTKPVVHVRPRGPLTEIQFWYFYPFNGPGRLEICWLHCENEVFDEAGRHWGDWEMVSLLVDNTSQSVVATGMSHHGDVLWVQYAHVEKHANGVRPLVFSALNSHAHYQYAGEHHYAVMFKAGPIKATTYDLTSHGALVIVGDYYLAPDEQSIDSTWLGFSYRWGQYIWNFDEVYFLSTNYHDQEEVNPGPSGPPMKPEW
jgi:hypothetical protein